jgi:hypothetical protein
MDRDQQPLTEAEYAAMLPALMGKIAGELNECLAGMLPPGMRFEWAAKDQEGDHP